MDQTIFEYISGGFDRFWHNIGQWLNEHAFNILLILLFAWLVKRYGGQFFSRIFHRTIREDLYPTKVDRFRRLETIDGITAAILQVGVVIVAGIMIISELGVDTTPLVASAGVIGIALGFGAQSLIKDLTSGLFIIIDNQYRVGDFVKLGDVSGTVTAINIRTTVLRALDGTLYHVPNGSIDATANLTMGYGGINEDIIVNEDTDIQKLTMVINRVGSDMASDPVFGKKIIEAPHFERIVGLDSNGIKVKILAKTAPGDPWKVRGELYRRLIEAFRKAKIEIATTQVTLHQLNPESPPKKSKPKK